MSDAKDLTLIESDVPAFIELTPPPPALIAQAGSAPTNAWHDFFGTIQNHYTRRAYEHAVRRFLNWLPSQFGPEQIRPAMVGRYIAAHVGSIPTRKLHLAALRAVFDFLVTRHIVVINPAASVRGLRHVAVEGKTREITIEHAKALLASIRLQRITDKGEVMPLVVGLRDRGLEVTRPVLVVVAGSKALSAALRAVFDHPVMARCQLHKIRNVVSKLPGSNVASMTGRLYAFLQPPLLASCYRNPLPVSNQEGARRPRQVGT